MRIDLKTYRVTDPGKTGTAALAIGVTGLAASAAGYFVDSTQFFFSYLTAFLYWMSIALGAWFFVMLHHLVQAKWSVVLRRQAEAVMTALPFMIIFIIPAALGIHPLFHWSHADAVAVDPILLSKAGYLNVPFFSIRSLFYVAVWAFFGWKLYRMSLAQDAGEGGAGLLARFRRVSAPGVLFFALTVTFFAYDWIMSLDAHWYSTIFGPYYFSGAFLAFLTFLALMVIGQRRQLAGIITEEHYHDLGKLIFAFLIFWSYMAFSQYFLQWYANIPEETIWYAERWKGGWRTVSLLIVWGHFVAPFVLLIFRASKRSPKILGGVAVWLLLMHWVDLHWLVMPNLHTEGAQISWMDFSTLVGLGGVFVWYILRQYALQPVVALKDPGLGASIRFTNQ